MTSDTERVGPKARAAVVLADELARRGADLLVLIGSTSTSLAPGGQTSYVAANAVLDALAGPRGRVRVVTMDYGVWAGTGMAAHAARKVRLGLDDGTPVAHPVLAEHVRGRDGAEAFVGRLDASHDWVVQEHRTENGTALLPGTGHVELMLAALAHAGLAGAGLRNIALTPPRQWSMRGACIAMRRGAYPLCHMSRCQGLDNVTCVTRAGLFTNKRGVTHVTGGHPRSGRPGAATIGSPSNSTTFRNQGVPLLRSPAWLTSRTTSTTRRCARPSSA